MALKPSEIVVGGLYRGAWRGLPRLIYSAESEFATGRRIVAWQEAVDEGGGRGSCYASSFARRATTRLHPQTWAAIEGTPDE